MSTRPWTIPLASLAALLMQSPLHGQSIRGIVVNTDGEALPHVVVRLTASSERAPIETLTDSLGQFGVQLRGPGTVVLTAEAVGYGTIRTDTLNVDRGEVLSIRVTMNVAPVELPAVEVIARSRADFRLDPLRGFNERMDRGQRIGAGYFITREDAHLKGAARVTHVLGSAPGIRTRAHPGIPGALIVEVRTAATGACPVLVYVDGMEISNAEIDGFVLPSEIHGMEVYRRPSELPAEFSGSNARCGVIAIWTRRWE